jgi:hypothetical protein
LKPQVPRRMEIPVPIRGFVEGMSGVGQPPATYAAGFNMRCCDPGSEQVGLTPRAGLVEMASALAARRERFSLLAARLRPTRGMSSRPRRKPV